MKKLMNVAELLHLVALRIQFTIDFLCSIGEQRHATLERLHLLLPTLDVTLHLLHRIDGADEFAIIVIDQRLQLAVQRADLRDERRVTLLQRRQRLRRQKVVAIL